MSSPDGTALRVALAAACMARGLVETQAEEVFAELAYGPAPETVGEAYRQIEAAISRVRNRGLGLPE